MVAHVSWGCNPRSARAAPRTHPVVHARGADPAPAPEQRISLSRSSQEKRKSRQGMQASNECQWLPVPRMTVSRTPALRQRKQRTRALAVVPIVHRHSSRVAELSGLWPLEWSHLPPSAQDTKSPGMLRVAGMPAPQTQDVHQKTKARKWRARPVVTPPCHLQPTSNARGAGSVEQRQRQNSTRTNLATSTYRLLNQHLGGSHRHESNRQKAATTYFRKPRLACGRHVKRVLKGTAVA